MTKYLILMAAVTAAFISVLISPRLPAQLPSQIELACPAGSQVVQPVGQTYNASTGKYRQWLCVDSFGNIVQATGAGASFPLLAPNGSNSAPSYSFSSATNSGIFASSSAVAVSVVGTTLINCGSNQCNYPSGGEALQIGSGLGGSGVTISNSANNGLAVNPGSGAGAGSGGITSNSILFTNLPAAANGTIIYCSDCLVASVPCSGSSTGTFALRINGAWRCQ